MNKNMYELDVTGMRIAVLMGGPGGGPNTARKAAAFSGGTPGARCSPSEGTADA